MKDDQELQKAVERQEGRIRTNTYAEMSDAIRGASLLMHVQGKARSRERALDGMERDNEEAIGRALAFTAANLPADTYIK